MTKIETRAYCAATKFEEVQYIVCQMWDWLSPRRKAQCVKALKTYVQGVNLNKKVI